MNIPFLWDNIIVPKYSVLIRAGTKRKKTNSRRVFRNLHLPLRKIVGDRTAWAVRNFRFGSIEKAVDVIRAFCDMLAVSLVQEDEHVREALVKLFRMSLFNPDLGTSEIKNFALAMSKYLANLGPIVYVGPLRSVLENAQIKQWIIDLEQCKNCTVDSTPDHDICAKIKRAAERLVNFTSARGCPKPSDGKVEVAIKKFLDLVTSSFEVKPDLVDEFVEAARILGKSCKPRQVVTTHLSIVASAGLDSKSAEGGKMAEFQSEFLNWMTEKAPSREVYTIGEQDHFGSGKPGPDFESCEIPAGQPRWQWFFADGLFEQLFEKGKILYQSDFFEEIPMVIGDVAWGKTSQLVENQKVYGEKSPHICGFWSGSAKQILYYCIIKGWDSRVRYHPIKELGGKVRMVTMSDWKMAVVQQSFAHILKDVISTHPRMSKLFTGEIMIWKYMNTVSKKPMYDSFETYVSDFSSATDAIPRKFAESVLRAFCESAGLRTDHFLLQQAFAACFQDKDLIRFRPSLGKDEEGVKATRGVFMGEAMAKPILTILMHCIDLVAVRRWSKQKGKSIDCEDDLPNWWAFLAPGDDHLTTGPTSYINELIAVSKDAGFIINEDKIFRTKKGFVKITEQWVWALTLRSNQSTERIGHVEHAYIPSPWVDSLKLKCFSTDESERSLRDGLSAIIGRAKFIAQQLGWIHSCTYNQQEKEQVRDYFLRRVAKKLPNPKSSLYSWILLPTCMGGLGLNVGTAELKKIYDRLPAQMVSVAMKISNGDPIARKRLDEFFRKKVSRGIELDDVAESIFETVKANTPEYDMQWFSYERDAEKIPHQISDYAARQWLGILNEGELRNEVERRLTMCCIYSKDARVAPTHRRNFFDWYRDYRVLWELGSEQKPNFCDYLLSTQKMNADRFYQLNKEVLKTLFQDLPALSMAFTINYR